MDSLHATYDAARRALDTGDGDHAAALLDQLLQQFPDFVDARQLLGEVHLQARHYHDAIATFEYVLAADPEHVGALYGLGAAHYYLGDETRAQAAWEQALEIQPNLGELRALVQQVLPQLRVQRSEQISQAGLARLYMRSGMLDQVIAVLRAEVHAQPQRTDLVVALAQALWQANRLADTRRVCYDLLALQPQLVKPTLLLAYMLIMRNEPGGTALWQRGAAQDPLHTIAYALFAKLPSLPAPAPHTAPVESTRAQVDTQQGLPNDDEALLLQLLNDVPAETDAGTPSPEQASSTLTMDELLMANGTPAQIDEQPSEPEGDNADPLVTAAVNTPNDRAPTGTFDALLAQADTEPAQHMLRLIVARITWASQPHGSLEIYKRLVKDGALLADVVLDLREQVEFTGDGWLQQRIYRLLGDAYMRQHRVAEATQAYNHAFPDYARPLPAS